jgi:hypothetical protein
MKFRHLVFTRPAVEALTEQLLATINRGRPVAPSDGDAEKQESVQHGGARPMEHDAVARANAGESPDLALADAAEDVARPDASLEVSDTVPAAEADTGSARRSRSARSASDDVPAASAADADEDKKEDA